MQGVLHIILYFTVIIATSGQDLSNSNDCPARCLCFKTTVRCMFLQLDQVPVRVPPETTILDLRFNRIKEIPSNTFRQLRRLNTLLLNNNHITRIGNSAFAGLRELRYLYLYKNRIQTVGRHAFRGLPKLEQLYIHFNRIETFEEDTFANLPSLERLFLHNNRLSKIPGNAFKKLESLRRLRLDSNALICDCEMLWVAQSLKEKESMTQATATCQSPITLQGKSLMELEKGDFRCKKPQLTQEPNDVDVTFGGTVYFTCKAEGEPDPEIVWLHNSNEVQMTESENNRYNILKDGTLMITKAQDQDQGVYECMAKNMAGEVKSRAAKMIYNRESVISNIDSPYNAASKPYFIQKPLDRQLVSQGASVTLPCDARGHPKPEISWTFQNGPIEISSKYSMTPSGSLSVTNINLEDAGSYRCIAANYHGRVSVVSQLVVGIPPKFVESPEDLLVLEGDLAEFKCYVEGKPDPQIAWTKDGRPLELNPRLSVLHTGTVLRIREVQASDAGKYTCLASSQSGSNNATARLQIKTLYRAPELTKIPINAEVILRSRIEIPCRANGDPRPFITWQKDGVDLTSDPDHVVAPNGHLFIYNVQDEDAGRYKCVAKNRAGQVDAEMHLTIKDDFNSVNQLTDRLIVTASLEASSEVDKAINATIQQLFEKSNNKPTPTQLFKALRYPSNEARELAKAAEVYDRTIDILLKQIVGQQQQQNASEYSYKLLSSEQLKLVANLSGCLQHTYPPSCDDMCYHTKYRTIDGTCNNLNKPWLGSAFSAFHRHLPPEYENGLHTPIGWAHDVLYKGFKKPNPRSVSTDLIVTKDVTPDDSFSHMLMQWGQFVDHDMDFSLPAVSHASFQDTLDCVKSCENVPPCFPIQIPDGDTRVRNRSFEVTGIDDRCIEFVRSSAVCGSGVSSLFSKSVVAPREQVNQLTSFIDGSNIYGSTSELSTLLRNFTFPKIGLLRVQHVGLPPQVLLPPAADFPMDCQRDINNRNDPCFLAGDVRANEQLGLLSMHTLWVREHNRIIRELREVNPHWDGDLMYHEARKIVGGILQHITFKHWLPKILGPRGSTMLGEYKGYDPSVNPSISNVFATAALRFGHTLINPILTRLGWDYKTIREGDLPLHKVFFAPHRLIDEGGIDPLLRGLLYTPAKIRVKDQMLNEELVDNLFKLARTVALDLAAINIQRGRDHALPGYNKWRKFCNLSVAVTFEDLKEEIKSDEIRKKLKKLYGHPDNIDVWVGGVSEELVEGSRVGPTLLCLLVDQFKRIRDGDRFWYENPGVFKPQQLTEIKQSSLSKVLCHSGDNITRVTRDVFALPDKQGLTPCEEIPDIELRLWSECCHDCSSSGVFSSVTKVRKRLKRSTEQFSYPEDRPTSSRNSTVDGAVLSTHHISSSQDKVDIDELRLENLEEVMGKMYKTIRQLNRKVQKLESQCQRPEDGKCRSADGRTRQDGETWKPKNCASCTCQAGQITCNTVESCGSETNN